MSAPLILRIAIVAKRFKPLAILSAATIGLITVCSASNAPASNFRLCSKSPGAVTPTLKLDMPPIVAKGNGMASVQGERAPGTDGFWMPRTIRVVVSNQATGRVLASLRPNVPDLDPYSTKVTLGGFVPDQKVGTVVQLVLTYEARGEHCQEVVSARVTIAKGDDPVFSTRNEGVGAGDVVVDLNPPMASCDAEADGSTKRHPNPLTEIWTGGMHATVTWHLTPCEPAAPPLGDGVVRQLVPGLRYQNAAKGGSYVEPGGFEFHLEPGSSCEADLQDAGADSCQETNYFGSRSSLATKYSRPGYSRSSSTTHLATAFGKGTDAFVNYCINTGKQTYSSDLRLYCNHPAVENDDVKVAR